MPADAMLWADGARVGRYQPIRRLAVGGMAEIHLARLPGVGIEGLEKLAVLKRILPQHALDPDLLRMFVDEARLSATLTHPNITEVYDVGADGDAPFFAMEYVHGANLREILNKLAARAAPVEQGSRRLLPLEHALAIVASAAAGLHYAHERRGPGGEPLGIVHRDVSPSNVLVSYEGAVKVSDFGIAKWALQRTRTQAGTLKGKFAYMSPEQCRGEPVDRRSDVFALGAILYELTTGETAFRAATDLEILNQVARGRAEPPRWPDREYPAALAAVVMRALAPEARDRFPTMQQLQLAIQDYARDAGIASSEQALGAFMQDLFAEELGAWRVAEDAGQSLGEHLSGRNRAPAADPPRGHERTATDAFAAPAPAPRTPERARLGFSLAAVGALAALGVTAGGLWIAAHRRTAIAPAAAAAGTMPAPAPRVTAAVIDGARSSPVPSPAPRPVASEDIVSGRGERPARLSQGGSTKTAHRIVRTAHQTPPTPSAPPTPDSRLSAWDPDSPVPP